jgi:flagellar hook-associated protein 2
VADAVAKINDLGGGVTATLVNDGTSGAPIRMSLSSDRSGAAGALGFDATQVAFTLRDSARAQDALLLFGGAADAATGLLAASPTDRFDQLVEGLRIQVNGSTLDPVALEITRSDAALVARVQTLVDAYNALDARLDAYTSIDLETFATGPLYNSIETRRVRQDLSQLLGGRFGDGGAFRTLSSVGIELASDGTLSLDAAKLKEAFAADPESVERLFTAEALGVAARLDAVAETLVGPDRSLLLTSAATLAAKIAANTERIAALSARLARSRERLFGEFTRLESTIARIQSDLSAVTAIQALLPISGLTGRTS